jgi:predicted O-methyltransferase YrrM
MVIELGSWLGSSTRFIADRCKHVIAIDHWKGGPEHHNSTWQSIKGRLPKLYETFLRNCWSRKDKITPLKMDTVEGLTECSKAGVSPNLIYIDASHEYTDVIADLTLAAKLFPKALIIGDDWERKGVHQAVMNYTYSKDIVLKVYGNVWWIR